MAFDVQKTSIEISATDKTGAAFNSIKTSITGLTAQFGALSGLLGAGAFVAMTKRIIDQADSMNDLSKRTGIAVEQLGAWRLATEQSGTSMEALTAALGKGSKFIVQNGEDLRKIGINAKTSEELILQLSGVISKLPSDDPRRTALAMQVLGKSAGELIPLLSEGEEGLRGMLETGRRLNPVTESLAKNSDAFNDSMAELKLTTSALGVNFANELLPAFTQIVQKMQQAVEQGGLLKGIFAGLGEAGKIGLFGSDKSRNLDRVNNEIPARMKFLTGEINKSSSDVDRFRLGLELKALANESNNLKRSLGLIKEETAASTAAPSDTNLDSFLKKDGGVAKKDAIAERIKSLGAENALLAEGKSLEDARTIARLKAEGASKAQIDLVMRLTAEQNRYEAAESLAEKTKQDLVKATQDHAEAMKSMLETSDSLVLNAQREFEESERNLQVMKLGETAVIRMESARLLEAAASAEQGLAYARLNGLSQENIDFTETQILRLKQLAEARLKFADSADANAAFEKDKERIKDLEKEQKDAAKRVADEQNRFYDQLGDNLGRALTEGLFDSFKKGESFGRAMLKNITAFGKTALAQIFQGLATNSIKGLFSGGGASALGGLGSIFSGSAQAAGSGGGGGLFGGLSSILDVFKKGNFAIDGAIQSFSNIVSNAGFDKLGAAIFQNSGLISQALPFAGAAFNLLTGDVKGALGSALGAALSFTPLGPVGGLIGSIVGGGLFGGKKQPPRTVTALPDVNEQFINTLTALTKGFGLESNITANARYSGRSGGSGYGFLDASVNGTAINEGIRYKGAYGEATMKQFIDTVLVSSVKRAIESLDLSDGIKKFFKDLTKQEEIAATINGVVSLNAQLKTLPPVFDAIRKALNTTDFNIGIAALQKQFNDTSVFTSLFYTAEEQFKIFTDQLTGQLSELNTPLLKTRDEFRKLIDGFNVTDEASSKLFGGLVALAPAMDSYFKQLEAQRQQFAGLNADYFSTSSDFLTASALAGQGRDFTGEIGELSTVRQKADAESSAAVQALIAAQADTKALLEAVAKAVQETARIQKIWNGDGLPETRVI
jgi:hypothetical protein